jgi:hypothetical protein
MTSKKSVYRSIIEAREKQALGKFCRRFLDARIKLMGLNPGLCRCAAIEDSSRRASHEPFFDTKQPEKSWLFAAGLSTNFLEPT